jgi:hypothetical protein
LSFSWKEIDYDKFEFYPNPISRKLNEDDFSSRVKEYLKKDDGSASYLRQRILAYELNAYKKLNFFVPEHIYKLETLRKNQILLFEVEKDNNIFLSLPKVHNEFLESIDNLIEFYKNNLDF